MVHTYLIFITSTISCVSVDCVRTCDYACCIISLEFILPHPSRHRFENDLVRHCDKKKHEKITFRNILFICAVPKRKNTRNFPMPKAKFKLDEYKKGIFVSHNCTSIERREKKTSWRPQSGHNCPLFYSAIMCALRRIVFQTLLSTSFPLVTSMRRVFRISLSVEYNECFVQPELYKTDKRRNAKQHGFSQKMKKKNEEEKNYNKLNRTSGHIVWV